MNFFVLVIERIWLVEGDVESIESGERNLIQGIFWGHKCEDKWKNQLQLFNAVTKLIIHRKTWN